MVAELQWILKLRRRNRRGRKPAHALQTHDLFPTRLGTRSDSYHPLTGTDIERISSAALDVLAKVGVGQATPTVRELALAAGCSEDRNGRLLFSRSLVEDVIAGAARNFVLHGQTKAHDVELRGGHVHFATGGAAVKMLDSRSRTYRASTLADIYDLARLADTLPNIQWFTRPVVATEIENWRELDLNTVYAIARGTAKHLGSSITLDKHVPEIIEMLDTIAGVEGAFRKRPFLTVHATTIVSPLAFAQDSSDVATMAARKGMPILSLTGPQAGATAPVALAGTLVQAVAESLGALVAINLVKPGHPVIASGWPFVSDLRTGAFSGGSGEQSLLAAGQAQIMRYYDLPTGVPAGMTDSKLPDNQAGFEKSLSVSLAALSGPDFVYESAGMLASLLGCSLEAMVIDDEMITNIRRVLRGIEVSDANLSVDEIVETTLGAGHFLGNKRTLDLMKSEFVYPDLSDRSDPASWQESGSTDIWDRAARRVAEIMRNHHPGHVTSQADRNVRARYPILLPEQYVARATSPWMN